MGAVSLIRVSGPEVKEKVGRVFRGKASDKWEPRYQYFGRIVDAEGETIDEVLLTWFQAPHSFTGEEVVEIACHGGILVTQLVLDALLAQGMEVAGPGEFSQRAFFNGKMDLTQAEAIMDLISAQTELAAQAAKEQLKGRLGESIEKLRQRLVRLLAHLEAYVDFPDEDIDPDSQDSLLAQAREIVAEMDALLATADQGRLLREGIRTAIVGAPNAGKSSLLNLLLGYDRAIVSDQAGTTRDTLEEVVNLGGVPVRLVDTAGIRDVNESIEREGIDRSHREMERAEWIWWIVDASAPKSVAEAVVIPEGRRVILLLNKSDQPRHTDWAGADGLAISALETASKERLVAYFIDRIRQQGNWQSAHPLAINARHQRCLMAAKGQVIAACGNLEQGLSPEFIAMDLRAALDDIGGITGKTDVEEILGEIFSTFCIGK